MSRPDSTPVSVTPEAIKAVIAHALHAREFNGSEACGFVFGTDGVGTRVVGIRNDHPDPRSHFRMSDEGVIDAMKEADEKGEDLIAVYHSHPESSPVPSDGDKATPDVGPGSPAYIIVGLAEPDHPAVAAYRIDLPFIGQPRATRVQVAADGQPFIAKPPLTPWALTPGNKIALTYQRPGHANRRTIICEINGATGDLAEPGKVMLAIHSSVGTDPKQMLVERVKAARVLRESPQAGRVRQRVADYGARLASAADHGPFDDVAKYSAFITASFPGWLNHAKGE